MSFMRFSRRRLGKRELDTRFEDENMRDKELITYHIKSTLSGLATAAFIAAVLYNPLSKELRLNRQIDGDYTGIIPAPGNDISKTLKVNINTASEHFLTRLDGIGEATAREIIKYREEYGAFKSVDELTNVKGIGEKTLSKIRERIVV